MIGTTGNEAHDISARFSPADVLDDTNKIAINVKGTINTEGDSAAGIYGRHDGEGKLKLDITSCGRYHHER
ncbi:hypothetical protein [Candidatus Vondammii sp. HM_W22]|uniref:hypothetical protein n=1 Tax=Candidatus Vondammii sp. HM_W22 TaxID=2687299 RepID=UPI001F1496B7|nr:hypothetical protein [Candidatus Vondammii sp. HM_W22]